VRYKLSTVSWRRPSDRGHVFLVGGTQSTMYICHRLLSLETGKMTGVRGNITRFVPSPHVFQSWEGTHLMGQLRRYSPGHSHHFLPCRSAALSLSAAAWQTIASRRLSKSIHFRLTIVLIRRRHDVLPHRITIRQSAVIPWFCCFFE